ncbi:MAG: hypothetical protein KAH86_04705 [Methanosarcinales archaeon]|nr:hypothetical protein [Methanosarcinales archaeon]
MFRNMYNIYANTMISTAIMGRLRTPKSDDDSADESTAKHDGVYEENYEDDFFLDDLEDDGDDSVITTCPTCAKEQTHTIIKQKPNMRIQCDECNTVQAYTPKPAPKTVKVKVIVSKNDKSMTRYMDLPEDEDVGIESELLVEDTDGDEVNYVEVTDIELPGKRVGFAKANEITTIWARAIDKVYVKYAINQNNITDSKGLWIEGTREFVVGSIETIGRDKLKITSIKCRDGSFARRDGDLVPARDVKRIFAKDTRAGQGQARRWTSRRQDGTW